MKDNTLKILDKIDSSFRTLKELKEDLIIEREELVQPIIEWFAYDYKKYKKVDNLKFEGKPSNNYLGIVIKFKNELESDFGTTTLNKNSWFFGTKSLIVSDHSDNSKTTLEENSVSKIRELLIEYNQISHAISLIQIPF